MAKFTAPVPLNIRLPGGFEVAGAVGATHRIPDALVEEFIRDQVPVIPGGVTWITQDETSAISGFDPSTKYDKTGGTISGAVTATGAVSGATLSATGAISGASASVTGAVNASAVAATGAITAATITTPALTATAARFKGDPWHDVKAYGAVGNGATDDTVAIQAAITAAFNAPGGTVFFPIGTYSVSATLSTPANTGGAITLLGGGRTRSFAGGVDGDPAAAQGVTLSYTGSTGDIFQASLTGSNTRQYITIEKIGFAGNSAGASGHGLHFVCSNATAGILVCLRDVTVINAKQSGVFFDGDIFESQLYNVRLSQNGDRGFKAASNGSALPGETRFFGCTFDHNNVGMDLAGGGRWSLHGISLSRNTNEGLIATSVYLDAFDLQIEVNGSTASTSSQATFTSLTSCQFVGVVNTVVTGGKGIGMKFVSCNFPHVNGFRSNSSLAGVGYNDLSFDNATSRAILEEYTPDDGVDKVSLGTLGGHMMKRGGSYQSYQTHRQVAVAISATTTLVLDATLYDSFVITFNSGTAILTLSNPTIYNQYHDGQRIVWHIFNNTATTIQTINWPALFKMAGTFTNPLAGKTRTIELEYNATRNFFIEVSRAAADIT